MRAALLIAACAMATAASADIFSPGELAKPHSSLEGIANCTKCHPEGGRLSQETCLACHSELKPELAAHTGLHGRIPQADRSCETCHADHQGVGFNLINWGPAGKRGFEHGKSGWALKGKHLGVKCDVCHEPRRIEVASVVKLLQEHPGRTTSLGLGTACTGCHFDEHRGQLTGGCQTCHQETGWKLAAGFSHDETGYPLKGKHVTVACAKCHTPATQAAAANAFPAPVSETFLKFTAVESKQCSSCHKDPHDGRFGASCTSCHSVEGWRSIRNLAQERGFHDQTRYPLKGEHLDVACTACHGPSPGRKAKFKGLAFAHCTDCHSDAHDGQLAKESSGKPADCKRCHSVEGFSPPRFTLADHQQTEFKLEGAHRVVGCAGCHQQQAPKQESGAKKRSRLHSAALFELTKVVAPGCSGCHADVHEGQFDLSKGCQRCHSAETFHQVTFNHDVDSRFPLAGKHAGVLCAKCHVPSASGVTRFKPLETACASCHADPHAGQFGTSPCATCHDTKGFRPASGFMHQAPFTDFVLEGKHSQVACERCHPSVAVAGAKRVQRFLGAPRTCEGCHSDFHKGAFEGFAP